MKRQTELKEELIELLGSANVYFEPPDNLKMKYPCFVYELSGMPSLKANNKKYIINNRYMLKYIHKNVDTDMKERILEHFMHCRFERSFVSENLRHDVFELYF